MDFNPYNPSHLAHFNFNRYPDGRFAPSGVGRTLKNKERKALASDLKRSIAKSSDAKTFVLTEEFENKVRAAADTVMTTEDRKRISDLRRDFAAVKAGDPASHLIGQQLAVEYSNLTNKMLGKYGAKRFKGTRIGDLVYSELTIGNLIADVGDVEAAERLYDLQH